MYERGRMSDFVNHLRFVHNTQTILSLTILYLVLSSWTSGPELRSDLEGFLRTVDAAREVVEMPERLPGLVPEMPNHHLVLSAEITSTIGYPVLVVNPLRIRSATSLPNNASTVGAQWRALRDQEWILQKLGNPEDDLSEVGAWLDERKPYRLHLNRELRRAARLRPGGGRRLSAQDIRRLTTPILLPSVTDWPAESSSGFAIVELEAYVPMPRSRFRGSCEDLTGIAKHRELRRNRELGIIFDCKTLGPYRFVAQTDTVRLPPSAFDRYPYLQRELEAIADLTPNDALVWAAGLQVEGIRERDPRFFGTPIRGEHLGFVVPAAMILLQFYFLIMLYNLRIFGRKGSFDTALLPWVVTMKQWYAMVYSYATLVVVPAATVSFALWRLTTIDRIFILAVTLIPLGIGIWIVRLGLEVGQCVDATTAGAEP